MTGYMPSRGLSLKARTLQSGLSERRLSLMTLAARKLDVDDTLGRAASVQDVLGQPQLARLAKYVLTVVSRHLRRSPVFVLPNLTIRKEADVYWHVDYFFLRYANRPEIISEIRHISVPLSFTKLPICAWPVEIIEKSLTCDQCAHMSFLLKIIRHCRKCGKMRTGDILLWHGGYVHRSAPAYRRRHLATLQLTIALTPRAKNLFIKHIAERAMMPGKDNDRHRHIVSSPNIRSQVQQRVGSRRVRSG